MTFYLKPFLTIQKGLDEKILTTQGITKQEVALQSHLCIMVELMELCNETRCFNYWSKKQRGSDEAILEEFADVMCFLLSAISNNPFEEIEIDETIKAEDKVSLTKRFLELTKLYALLDNHNLQTYKTFLRALLELGLALGYSIDQIYDAYTKKVQKNYQVQDDFKQN